MEPIDRVLSDDDDDDDDETEEEKESFSSEDVDGVPPSLLSYFKASNDRASKCEKFILKDAEDLSLSNYTVIEDTMNLPLGPGDDSIKPNEQVTCSRDNKESNTSTAARWTHDVSVCQSVKAGANEYMEAEEQLEMELRAMEISLKQKERQTSNKCEAEREKRRREEKRREDRRKQTETDFQEELRRIMESKELHQREVELMERRAQENLEQEFFLQQEVISKLRRRVEEEMKMREEEQRRREEEKKMEEEIRRKEEEERRLEEMRREKEENRRLEEIKRMEEEIRKKEEEDRRMEEKKRTEEEVRRIEEERRTEEAKLVKKAEDTRKKEEERRNEKVDLKKTKDGIQEHIKTKIEMEDEKTEEEPIKIDLEKKKLEDEERMKKGAERIKQEVRELQKKRVAETESIQEERKEAEKRKNKEEMKEEKQEAETGSKDPEEMRGKKGMEEEGNGGKRMSQEEMREGDERGKEETKLEKEKRREEREEARKGNEEEKRKEEGGNGSTEEDLRPIKEDEKLRREEEDMRDDVDSRKNDENLKEEEKKEKEEEVGWNRKRVKMEEGMRHNMDGEKDAEVLEERGQEGEMGQGEGSVGVPDVEGVLLPVSMEEKRRSWMADCVSWSKLSPLNRRKQRGPVRSRRGPRKPAEVSSPSPPLHPDILLRPPGCTSLKQVTSVTLENLPGCGLSTLALCPQLQFLRLRRCGLRSLHGLSQLQQLSYIDVQDNDISFLDCENMTGLRVLLLGRNKLTSIHGLSGAEHLDVLDLSYNSISRIAGLESVRRLQRLLVDHNQLISTKGLRDVYTLLHLSCSHNHLVSVEGLENSALLGTLDLSANSLTEPPCLSNQVLLRELRLDDNSISCLQGLAARWLPLLQRLSVAQNRITWLPSMSDYLSLTDLDLSLNCMSDVQNVCESLEGCHFLREVHLSGNPLQQEAGWRCALQKAVPSLKAVDSSLSPPAADQEPRPAPGSFLALCQAQLQQTLDLERWHSRELSVASSSLDAAEKSYRHFTEALRLAEHQRLAHEYGDAAVVGNLGDVTPSSELREGPETELPGSVPPVVVNMDVLRCGSCTVDEKPPAEGPHQIQSDAHPSRGPRVTEPNSDVVHSIAAKTKTVPATLDIQNAAAAVIQRQWRKCRQKLGNVRNSSMAENEGGRGDKGMTESGPSHINGSASCQDYAATVIQAVWRGFSLRRRLACVLAAVMCPSVAEEDVLEEVDVDEFVLDEEALEKQWTWPMAVDSSPRFNPELEQPASLKVQPFPDSSQSSLPPPAAWRSKEAWVAAEQVDSDSAGWRDSPVSFSRSKSATSELSGPSKTSEEIMKEWGFTHSHTALLMLKRAQRMKSKTQQQKKDPVVHLVFGKCRLQLSQVEARNRRSQHIRDYSRVGEAEPDLLQAERMERAKRERTRRWLRTQAAQSAGDLESVSSFLPEINSEILNGGRVQLVADGGHAERLRHASGVQANSSVAVQPWKKSSYHQRNSLGPARETVPPPKPVAAAPLRKERVSFRDDPVRLSGGWGSGRKKEKVSK